MTRGSIREYTEALRERYLRADKTLVRRRPITTTKPGSLLKNAIPIRTFADWVEHRPGFFEIDLVSHC